MNLHEVYRNSGLGKWFHGESATKQPGWDRYNSEGKRVGKCGDAEEGAAYSACLSKQKAQKLGKKGVGNFVKRKRAAQNESGRGEKGTGKKGKKPIFVKTGASKMEECYECEQNLILEGKNKPNDPEKWSACKSAAKSKFDVYPSAYANAWASKCYKKKGGTWSSIKEETDMNDIKEITKLSILNNFMENAKPEFARRGAEKQRPKSWSKGTKSGSDKRKMREQGKRQSDSREVYEQYTEPGYQYNPQPDDPRPGQPGGPRDIKAEREEMGKSISNAVHDWVEETGLHQHHGHSTDEMREALKARIENSYDSIADATSDLISVYPAPKGVDPKQYKKHMEQGIHGYATGTSPEHRHEMLTGNPYYDAINESYNRSSYYYNRLKEETNDIPHHAQVTGEEVYGAMDPHAEYRNQLPGNHPDNVRAEHRGNAMKELERITQRTGDQSHANSTVARGAIAAALAHMRLSNSNDPTLRHIESILNGHQDAFDDHFKLSQQKGDVPF